MRRIILTAIAVAACAAPALADVIRVPQDHGTIQAAVNAAAGGDKIIIGPGTYPENVVVNAKPNLFIRGRGLVTINPAAGSAIVVTNSANTRIKKVSTITTGFSLGIVLTGSPNSLVAKCRAQGSIGMGAAASDGTRFVACKINATNGGIGFGTSGTHTAERCVITSAAGGQAVIAGGGTVNLIRCKVTYTGVPTVSPVRANVSTRFYAERCRIQTAPAAASIFGFELDPAAPAAQHELVRNRIEGCNVGIGQGPPVVNGVVCTGNVMSGQEAGGIGLVGSNHVIERNKILLGPGLTAGIGLGFSTASMVTRNKVISGGVGVWFLAGNGNTVTLNKLKGLTFGVSLTGNANTIGPDNAYRNCSTPIDDNGVGTIILDTP